MKKIVPVYICCHLLCCCSLLSSDEFSSNYKQAYLHSKNGQYLVIPPPLTDANVSNFYQLPNQTKLAKISIKPPIIDADISEKQA